MVPFSNIKRISVEMPLRKHTGKKFSIYVAGEEARHRGNRGRGDAFHVWHGIQGVE
jgi:hypothetical protein